MDETRPARPKKPKFKYIRDLIRIAVADGMTQKEIADLCRVEQSVVSGWSRGNSLAFEHQVAELKKRYGSRLNRTTSRVYLTVEEATPGERWEDSERGRRLLKLREERKQRRDPKALHSPHDELTLPFLVRKMLVEQGHEVPGGVRIVVSE